MNIPSPGLAVLRAQSTEGVETGIFITSATGFWVTARAPHTHGSTLRHCTHSGTAAEPEEKRAREAAYYLYFSNRTTLINQHCAALTQIMTTGKEAGGKG